MMREVAKRRDQVIEDLLIRLVNVDALIHVKSLWRTLRHGHCILDVGMSMQCTFFIGSVMVA